MYDAPAAFRRLCVETTKPISSYEILYDQPPSGGCVLKHRVMHWVSRICFQPPSGGCVLKHAAHTLQAVVGQPAAFRRLCVET